jgi:hypothetical protein
MKNINASKLTSLKSRMLEAYELGDWQHLAELDRECQTTVKTIIADDPKAMFEELRSILGFYAELIAQCRDQRDEFAAEVKHLRQGRDQKNIYSNLENLSATGG